MLTRPFRAQIFREWPERGENGMDMLTSSLFVARGRTVWAHGKANGPGSLVSIEASEAERLSELGFLQSTPPVLTLIQVNPAGIGLQTPRQAQGPDFSRRV